MCHFSLSLLESHGVFFYVILQTSCISNMIYVLDLFSFFFFFNHGGGTSMNLEYFLGAFAH